MARNRKNSTISGGGGGKSRTKEEKLPLVGREDPRLNHGEPGLRNPRDMCGMIFIGRDPKRCFYPGQRPCRRSECSPLENR